MLTDVKTTTNANTQLVYITPTQAQAWLGNNDLNRNIRPQVVDMYARAMVESRWQINGETIKISETGKLLDGQHRLSACVKAGVGFYSLVVGGLPEDYFATIDTGLSRTHGDVLGIAGVRGGYTIAAAIRTVKSRTWKNLSTRSRARLRQCCRPAPAWLCIIFSVKRIR